MPPRRYVFITIDMVEGILAETVTEFFRDYPDPLPDYRLGR